MTRCYDAYCFFSEHEDACPKDDRNWRHIKRYIKFMRKKGVNFDRQPNDKGRFKVLQNKYGTERKAFERNNCSSCPLPSGEFDIIYADPPWRYYVNHLRANPEKYYPSMSVEEICDLKIPSSENAVLFLWATNPMLEDALKVMGAWGFKYKTNIVWVKNRFGTGFYVRGQHELLLLGVKGDAHPPIESNRFSSVVKADVREHSQKPTEVYEIIEKMYPDAHFLELFARNKRSGWEAWGNEV